MSNNILQKKEVMLVYTQHYEVINIESYIARELVARYILIEIEIGIRIEIEIISIIPKT